MNKEEEHIRNKMPNLLLIAGNGRNVGKTYFACRIIDFLSKKTEVCGVKISSHFHPINNADVLLENERFVILEEKRRTTKDSSLLLQAGAKKVLFIMATQENAAEAFEEVQSFLPQHAIICESGGLHEIITPGLFFFVNRNGQEIIKKHHLNHSPIIVNNNGEDFDFNINNINYSNHKFTLKQ